MSTTPQCYNSSLMAGILKVSHDHVVTLKHCTGCKVNSSSTKQTVGEIVSVRRFAVSPQALSESQLCRAHARLGELCCAICAVLLF